MKFSKFIYENNIEIYCINLITRTDKYKLVLGEFKKLGIDPIFHKPKKNKNPGMGCLNSHKWCIKDALSKNKHALVFEDDIILDNINYIEELNEFMNKNIKWDTLRLGCFLTSIHKSNCNTKHIKKCKSFMTHSILYNYESINKILLCQGKQIDDFLHDEKEIVEYGLVEPMFYQKNTGVSDNIWISSKVQYIMQEVFDYTLLQKYNNKFISLISFFPCSIQEKIAPWNLLYTIFR